MHLLRRVWFLVLVTACAACGAESQAPSAQSPGGTEADEAAIREVMMRQVDAWNQGDVEGFMVAYARTDSLRYASGGTVRRGWQTALDAYRRRYPDREAMGTLSFDSLDVRVLSPQWAFVFGRFQVERTGDASDLSGLFTLLFEKRPGPEGAAWRIVHDHTSSASQE